MKNRRSLHRITLIIACLIFASLALVTVMVAQQSESSTEPEDMQTADSQPASPSSTAYDSATSTGFAPDDNVQAGAEHAANAPQSPQQTFSYYQVSGTTLRGRNSSTTYAYDGVGCTHVTAGTGTGRILNTELILPDGAVIKYLRVYYSDASAVNGVEGYLTRYQPGVATTDLVHTGSTDAFAGGYGFVVSSEITETVNNTSYAYTLIGWPDDASANNQICGLRIAYYSPNSSTFLPTIIK